MVSYWLCKFFPIASSDFCGISKNGSIQHSNFAQGLVLTTSGGSVPMLRQTTSKPNDEKSEEKLSLVC